MATQFLDLQGLKTLYGVIENKIEESKPTKLSELQNDSNYQTENEVNTIVSDKIKEIVGDAPEAYDTLKEIADALSDNDNAVSAIVNTLSEKANSEDVYTKTEINNKIDDIENDFVALTNEEIEDVYSLLITPDK